MLHDCLDETSQRRLRLRRTEEPHLHFVEFWRQLESEFGRDQTTHYRDEWERVTLGGDGKLTVADWRNFQSKFELALGRVEDATETEVERKILVELPGKWRVKVNEEKLRRQQGQFWVRFAKPLTIPLDDLKVATEVAMGRPGMQWVRGKPIF